MPVRNRTKEKRVPAMLVVLMMLFVMTVPVFSIADGSLPSAGKVNPVIRVMLTRMNLSDRLDVTLASPYLLTTQEGVQMHFPQGSELAFLLRNGQIYLHYSGLTLCAGSSLTLDRTGVSDAGEAGFYRTNFPECYQGDLRLDVVDGVLQPVLSIHVEDYLLGVVPYEMSESFPVEALKAQAVAARTYALRKQNADRVYDLVDTTNDQVFKGYLPGNLRCEQAVRETRGVCGFYKGKLAQCYYSASNGGQMELVETVWETDADYGYYQFGADPYDVENPESVVRSYQLMKQNATEGAYELRQLIARLLPAALIEKYNVSEAEALRIDRINTVALKDPVHESSKLYTTLEMSVELSVRTHRPVLIDEDTEEVSLFGSDESATTHAPNAAVQTSSPAYGAYVKISEPLLLNIPIFPDAEYVLGMDISGNFDNEIWTVTETDDHFLLEARRYGHGVGMSQRGAQQMASAHKKSYQEIMKFYYPGLKLMQYELPQHAFALIDDALAEDAGPAASPTPRPTLMPVASVLSDGQWYAYVTEIDENSSLNLRSEPNLSSDILMRLYKNQPLVVLERCAQEGWLKVCTDTAEGYVMEKYLSTEKP